MLYPSFSQTRLVYQRAASFATLIILKEFLLVDTASVPEEPALSPGVIGRPLLGPILLQAEREVVLVVGVMLKPRP